MKEFFKVVTFQKARETIKLRFPERVQETLPLEQAYGRILAVDLFSPEPLPAFDRSTVDGYAVKARESFGCSEALPAFLSLAGEVVMGQVPGFSLQASQCAWMPTGGMLPQGADAVVMVEYTEKMGEDTVLIYRPVAGWENVMQRGEDVAPGQLMYRSGTELRPQDIGLLASLGFARIPVYTPYKVGIISTGDEIIPVEQTPVVGEIRDVNSFSLAGAVAASGNIPRNYPIVEDDPAALKAAIEQGCGENDLLLLSGGSSVGIKDVALDVLMSFPGSQLLFHGIAVKPGKPTLAADLGKKLVINLPGHPVSALMVFNILCLPLLTSRRFNIINALCSENIASQPGRDDFVPIRLVADGDSWQAVPLLGKSGLMSVLSQADAYIHIPYEQQGIRAGETVQAHLF